MFDNHHTPSQLTLADLLAQTRQYLASQDAQKIQRAYALASEAHKGTSRCTGEPFIQHPLEVALLLATLRIDADGIVAALLHDVVEDTHYSLRDLQEQFGSSVAIIVDGVTKFDMLTQKSSTSTIKEVGQERPAVLDKRQQCIETVRKMLLAMVEDPRVAVLKLADRLLNMRTLDAMNAVQQQNKARETREIYAPLARRLGMSLVQEELEDLAFKYLEPEKYTYLAQLVKKEMERHCASIDLIRHKLQEEMERAGIKAEVQVWQKHLTSINRKLDDMPRQPNEGEISQIYDLVSFRILVDTDAECYLALGHIHALWRPRDVRIKNFIATPKNGYQSLHTTVFCLEDQLAEIQIRTHEIQRTADFGIASYWHLQERVDRDDTKLNGWPLSYYEMVNWIKQLREWQRELLQSADEFVEAVKGDIFQEQIFVFTPKAEVMDLPRGSTPLDMAYRIHTDLGDHCAGANIIDTGRLVTRFVPLDYKLKGGEIVDIVVNSTIHPTRDWLSFARTTTARNKIRRYLKTYEREIDLQLGRERLDLALKALGAIGLSEKIEKALQALRDESPVLLKKYATLDDIYIALGRKDMWVENLMELFLPRLQSMSKLLPRVSLSNSTKNGCYRHGDVHGNMLVSQAHCCYPLPGDTIVGILHPNKGVLVHRCDCRDLRRCDNAKARVEINWFQVEATSYLVPITIVARDRAGLLRDATAVVADAGINMTALSTLTNASLQKAVITATLEIHAVAEVIDHVERIFRRLRLVKNVVSVERAYQQ